MASKWLQQVAAVLSLVPLKKEDPPAAAPHQHQHQHLHLSRQQQLLQRARSTPDKVTSPSIPAVRPGQRLAANLFKASLLCVSLPFAGNIVANNLIVNHLLRGIKSDSPQILKLTLQRTKSYLFCAFLVDRFDEQDGLILLMDLLSEKYLMSSETAVPYLELLLHLTRFEGARASLLMLGVVERLEQALEKGWLPQESRSLANSLYLDLHSARRRAVEEEYGHHSADNLGRPKVFLT